MKTARRTFIIGAGGGALALVGGAGLWRVTRRPETALKPWVIEGGELADVRLEAFRHAILAPNPHNRQPWLIRLVGKDEAIITCDLARRLPETDPFDRQITIGFGSFLETARIAAAQRGVAMAIMPFPEGEPQPRLDHRPLARLTFARDSSVLPDPLHSFITRRRTNRNLYREATPPPEAIIRDIAGNLWTSEPARIARIRAITQAAMTIEQTTPRKFGESIDLMRIGADEVDANPDGLAMVGPKMEAAKLIGMLNRPALRDQKSAGFKAGLEMEKAICGSFAAVMWLVSGGNSRADQFEAGRHYVRANLNATRHGVAIQPLSQSLQEYPEMHEQFSAIHRELGAQAGERIQMLARLGYAPDVDPAPRWPMRTHLLT